MAPWGADAELSKGMGEPMCLITSDEFKALAQSDRGALKYIGWMQERSGEPHRHLCQGWVMTGQPR